MRLTTTPVADERAPVVQASGSRFAVFYGTGSVRLNPDVSPDVLTREGLRILKQLYFAPNLFLVKGKSLPHLENARTRLQGLYVYFEIEGSFTAPVESLRAAPQPRDPQLDAQQYLDSMGIRRAWADSTGSGVTLGVVDAQFDARASELSGNWDWTRTAYMTTELPEGPVFHRASTIDEYPLAQDDSHGTQCAALAVGTANDINGVGVAFNSKLMAIAAGISVSPIMVARALAYCADPGVEDDGRQQPGCRVISCSMTDALLALENRGLVNDALDFLVQRDVLLVSAVSNEQRELARDFVSTHPCAIAVASVNSNGQRMVKGARGPDLDCVAETLGLFGSGLNDVWEPFDPGNSWAAPVVAGVVALLRDRFPDEDAGRIRKRLLSTCRDMHDRNEFGHGLVQADAAMKA
jgi:membrane-anchored mycosin MYCP